MADGLLFINIFLRDRGGINRGKMRVDLQGITWNKQGGEGNAITLDKSDLVGVTWMKVPRTYELGVRTQEGLLYKFTGFNEQDVTSLTTFLQNNFGRTPEKKQLSISGHNWGEVDLSGKMLAFLVGSTKAFEVSLADVSQTQLQGKNEIMLEFRMDGTIGANEIDSLMEISFHIPNSNMQYVGQENSPPVQVFRDKLMSMTNVIESGEVVVTFESINILTPRARYSVDLHLSFFRLQGQGSSFKIQYGSVNQLLLLPKSNQPHTFVVLTLDPPIRKGQTLYPYLVLQLETDTIVERTLSINEGLLSNQYKGKLEASYKGLAHDVFTSIFSGLSDVEVTKPGKFRSRQNGFAVRSSLRQEDGLLYPLEKEFFFLPKPTSISNAEIAYVEFETHNAGGRSMQYFDLIIRLKNEQEHVFQNIPRNEYENLLDFIRGKGLKIMNAGEPQAIGGVSSLLQDHYDDAVDPHLERARNEAESDEEDDDFVAEKDDSGSPTDDSEEDESSAAESGGERGVSKWIVKPVKKESRNEASTSKTTSVKKRRGDGHEDGPKKRKTKQKKDPNAPKKAMSGFMFFSQSERDNIRKSNPGIAFTAVSRALGDKWRNMTEEEKEPFQAKARADQKRYKEAMASYKGSSMVID